jgi:hypothetical protein
MAAGSTDRDWLLESACRIWSDYQFQTYSKRRCRSSDFIFQKMKLQASKNGQGPKRCSNGQLFWLVSEQSRHRLRKGPLRVCLPLIVAECSMREACSAIGLLNVILSSWTFVYEVWMDDLNDYSHKPKFSEVWIEKTTYKSFSPYCIVLESCLKRVLPLHSNIADCINTEINTSYEVMTVMTTTRTSPRRRRYHGT